jgi:hypothetical protein
MNHEEHEDREVSVRVEGPHPNSHRERHARQIVRRQGIH